ncbi:MAG: Uma2 family endonuclease [Halothece sp.]
MYPSHPSKSGKETLPTMYDLPSEFPEESGLPDEFHNLQPQLLRETFSPPTYPANQIFMGTDLNVYYDVNHPLWHKRPDWFAVVGVSRLYEEQDLRLSYVVWQEGVTPLIAVELVSPNTETEDFGRTLREVNQPPTKWEVYEQILGIPYYVVFNRYNDELRGFQLQGKRYQELHLGEEMRFWISSLELGLGVWQGSYDGIHRRWLRWFDAEGNWIPTLAEQREQERQRAEQQTELAQQERQRADQLAQKLQELGIDPNDLS